MSAGVPTEEELTEAWLRVQENDGCAGADGVTVRQYAHDAPRRLAALRERAASGTYRPFPLLKIVVEKKPGSAKMRKLLVPTVADRILQTAIARQMSRSFEEEFLECSYGYRPHRSVDRAIARIRKCRELGYLFVVDADIEAYFDRIDPDLLLGRLARREPGELTMNLLRLWIRGCVWDGQKIRPLRQGIAQGSPISPLLANFFLEDFDIELEKSQRKLVRYADDFIILARTQAGAEEALGQTRDLLKEAHLELNLEKTGITDFAHGFRFLGALFLGDRIWVPWKNERPRGKILFMARPLPPALRERFAYAPPQSAMEAALRKAGATTTPRAAAAVPKGGVSRVAYLYLTEQGSILRKAGDRFLVEKDDEVILDLPYHKLETVLVFGNVQVTTQALAELLEKGVNLSLFSRQGNYRGSLAPARGKNIELRVAQFELYKDTARSLGLARAVVEAKIRNALAVLNRYREKNSDVSEAFSMRRADVEKLAAEVAGAQDLAQLEGIEGAAARSYFDALMEFNRSALRWPGRVKHPSTDPLNALLSLTYTLLMHELTGLLEGVGLDPFLGFLHRIDYGRPSLALDLLEPLRHPIGDRLVLTLVNRAMVDTSDFQSGGEGKGVFLVNRAMKRYLAEYERWMLDRGAAGVSFRERLRAEVESFARYLRSGAGLEPYRFDEPKAAAVEAAGN
jgi:CRISPR-associated protein Cas1